MMKLVALFLCALCTLSFAENHLENLDELHKLGSTYYAYPTPNVKYTKAPKGYKPFYISHYGRHGSRFHYSADDYIYLYKTLAKADSLNQLSELGKSLFKRIKSFYEYAANRAGDLTQLGVKQHQEIAKRMIKNFPEIFKDSAQIEAYSSTSIRCVLSMASFLEELRAQKPKIKIHQESSKYLMRFICPLEFPKIINETNTQSWQKENEKLYSHVNPSRLIHLIFKDSLYVQENLDAGNFYSKLFEITNSLQNVPEIQTELYDLWTYDELFAKWKAQNAWWYNTLASSPLSNAKGLENAKPLLQDILTKADLILNDSKKNKDHVKVTLRFGHDTVILPFAALLQLENANVKTSDMENLHLVWKDYEISPMAANFQFIFYQSNQKDSPILVKLLHNEIEQNLPIECDKLKHKFCPEKPYVLYDDFKNFYSNILAK